MTILYGLCWTIDSRIIIWPPRAHFGSENESLKGLKEMKHFQGDSKPCPRAFSNTFTLKFVTVITFAIYVFMRLYIMLFGWLEQKLFMGNEVNQFQELSRCVEQNQVLF